MIRGSAMNHVANPYVDEPHRQVYDSESVNRIIRRALKLDASDAVSHQDLLETARDLGIDPRQLEIAIKEDQSDHRKENSRKTRMKRRRAKYQHHLWSYIIVIGALFLINIMTPGPWWFQWPMLGWGIGLAFHYRFAYYPIR